MGLVHQASAGQDPHDARGAVIIGKLRSHDYGDLRTQFGERFAVDVELRSCWGWVS